jgi:thiamine kinase-like enzyme
MSDFEIEIKRYMKNLPPDVLGLCSTNSIEIIDMFSGAYNLNFYVRVNKKKFIFRINIEQQSGLKNQIEYEDNVLRFLEGYNIAPTTYYADNTLKYFDFGILIEQYLDGPHLSYEKAQIIEAAELLAKLHSLPLVDANFIVWQDPLEATADFVKNDILNYEAKKTHDKKLIRLAKELMERTKKDIEDKRNLFHADSLNHTDVVSDNFIKTSDGLRLIDWEKPRVDDCTYDISCFLSEPAQLWCSEKVMNSTSRESFLNTYSILSRQKKDLLLEKIRIREPLVSLHWILWGAIKLCNLRDSRTAAELLKAHEEKISRYERLALPENIEKLLETL